MRTKLLITFLLIIAVNIFSVNVLAGDTSPAPADEPITLDIYPELIYQTVPEYPSSAKENGIEGKVYLKLFINTEGNVTKKNIQKSSGSEALDRSALTAADSFKFKPGIQDNRPVAVWVTVPIEFKLDKKQTEQENSEIDLMPELVQQSTPEYPDKAKRAGKEGDVWVKALIDKNGKVAEVLVEKSTCADCGFEESALKSALDYKFKPAVKDNQPVAAWVSFKVSYRLDSK